MRRSASSQVLRYANQGDLKSLDPYTFRETTTIAHLGGATLDNEENYFIKKLFTGGLGMVCVSNQARI